MYFTIKISLCDVIKFFVSGKSEVSWLGSTARKKKPKPTYSYQTQGRHMGQKPKLIPNENRSEDSESDVVEIKSKVFDMYMLPHASH